MASLQKRGLSREAAQAEFDEYMQTHAHSFMAALKYLSEVAAQFSELLRQHPQVRVAMRGDIQPQA